MPRIGGRKGSASIFDREVGTRLRAMRVDAGLSQEELGTALGVSFQQVQKYEKGTNRIGAFAIVRISNVLKTTPHTLLGWEADEKLDRIAGSVQFDLESYKLSRVFMSLPDELKASYRNSINKTIEYITSLKGKS